VSDKSIFRLAKKFNLNKLIRVYDPTTSFLINGKTYRFDKPQYIFNLPGISFLSAIRMGLGLLKLKTISNWRSLESLTAEEWLIRNFGENVYSQIWKPMLIGKWGEYYNSVNMAWFWARIKKRSQRLLYPDGGFQHFSNLIAKKLDEGGVNFQYNKQIHNISIEPDKKLKITTNDTNYLFDVVICTLGPNQFVNISTDLPDTYIKSVQELKSMAAILAIFFLKRPLTEEQYWINIPAESLNPLENDIPFLVCVEHTNMVPREHFDNMHIVYCGNYIKPGHELMKYSDIDLINLYKRGLKKVNKNFNDDDILSWKISRTDYATPVFFTNQSKNIPDIETPIKNLYWASMSHVYPWDRATNFAVEIGYEAAKRLSKNIKSSKFE